MNENESPIHSMNVSLGASHREPVPVDSSRHSWVVLICADLGFTSPQPQLVTAATLNEFFINHEVIISGRVEHGLPEEIAPFYIDYHPQNSADFSIAALSEKLPMLTALKNAGTILDAISRRRMDAAAGLKQILTMELPHSIVQKLGAIIPAGSSGGNTGIGSTGTVDTILSQMDLSGVAQPNSPEAASPKDLASLLTEGGQNAFSVSEIISCKKSIDTLQASLGATVIQQPFFRAACASWMSLKTVLKAAGRDRTLHFYLHSAPFDAAQRHFGDAVQWCAAADTAVDLVVWDYPVTSDTASMEQLENIGATADRFKTIVVTSLYSGDTLYQSLCAQEPLKSVVEQPAYIPLRRLQQNVVSRCLVLCAPTAEVVRREKKGTTVVAGAWLLTLQWVVSYRENGAPFHLQNSSVMALDTFAFPKLSRETVFDGHRCGLTVLQPNGVTVPRVLLGEADSPYGSMLFNLCVNRTARLAAEWIGLQDRSLTLDRAAPLLHRYLCDELVPYNTLTADSDLRVSVTDGRSLSVAIDSASTIAGFGVRFDFAFTYGE